MTTRPPGLREPRSYYLDNARTYLTALVIVHHTALPYGGFGRWIYKPAPGSPQYAPASSLPLMAFNALNQTYFMATFFLLSGYFSAMTVRKKDRRAWVRDKWKRLGVPTLLYSLFGSGVVRGVVAKVRDGAGWGEIVKIQWDALMAIRGVRGPVWYCALLLIFDMIYVYSRTDDAAETDEELSEPLVRNAETKTHREISMVQLLLALVCTASASFFIRVFYPLGKPWVPLALNLGYVPQYILFYATGILAYRHGIELYAIITTRMRIVLSGALVGITALGVWSMYSTGGSGQNPLPAVVDMSCGGFNRYAALYSLWNEVTGVLLGSVVLSTFHSRCKGRWSIRGFDITRYSYPAFLVHGSNVVFLQSLVDTWEMSGLSKTVMVGSAALPACWAAGWGLVKIVEGIGFRGYI